MHVKIRPLRRRAFISFMFPGLALHLVLQSQKTQHHGVFVFRKSTGRGHNFCLQKFLTVLAGLAYFNTVFPVSKISYTFSILLGWVYRYVCQKFSCNYFPLCHINGTIILV